MSCYTARIERYVAHLKKRGDDGGIMMAFTTHFVKPVVSVLALILLGAILLVVVDGSAAAACSSQRGAGCQGVTPRGPFSQPQPRPTSILTGVTYGWIEDYARFTKRPGPDAEWARTASSGFFYGPVQREATDSEGQRWLKVWDNWLPDRYYHEVQASEFTGVEVNVRPRRPFGWVLREFQARPAPAAEPRDGAHTFQRYDFVQLYGAQVGDDGAVWYELGEGRWVRYHAVALLTTRDRPQGVARDDFWVEVDLTQQTFAAYEGDRLVYAGLVSSGLPRWPTRRGLYKVWLRYVKTSMSGGTVGEDYYYLEDVPHTMYFDREIALHGAYWHDDFGRPKSHGCVNMPPRAAEWVYFWSQDAPRDLRVWVHASSHVEFLSR